MKKLFLFVALFAAMTINATDLFTGEHVVSSWSNALKLGADKFADAQPGQKIVVHYKDAGDVLELKIQNSFADHLAGSIKYFLSSEAGEHTFEQFLTTYGVEDLKAYGLELNGGGFTVTKVELLDGKELKEGITVWTGYYWADNWNSMDLYKRAYTNVNLNEMEAIRFYHEANRGDFVLNIRNGWGEGTKELATKAAMTDGTGYAELTLTDELRQDLVDADPLILQWNKESGSPFNVTDIVLVPKAGSATAIEQTNTESKAVKRLINGQVVIIRDGIMFNMLGAKF